MISARLLRFAIILLLAGAPLRAEAVSPNYAEGRNPWLGREFTRDDLLPVLRSSADYLVRQQLADGQFVYLNDPRGKARKETGDRYSMIRHLGAVYALLRSYEVTPNPDYLDAARRGLAFAKGFVTTSKGVTQLKGIEGKVNLGENGFLVLDLALYAQLKGPGHAADRALTDELAAFVADNLVYGNSYSTKEQWAECQAAMGLILYQETFGAPRGRAQSYVSVAEKWLIAAHKDGRRSHWSIQAAAWLARARPSVDKLLLEEGLLAGHQQLENVFDASSAGTSTRLIGAKHGKLYSCNATARNEGLVAAYQLARRLFRVDEAKFFLARVKEHLAFAMQFQYGNEGNFYENDPLRARVGRLFKLDGGVFDNPDKGYVRIDYVAHHLRAIAAYLASTEPKDLASLKLPELVGP